MEGLVKTSTAIEGEDMPLMMKGVYLDNMEERPYEVETTYQLKYYISSSLVSINQILQPSDDNIKLFDNKIQYYRYYVDSLFYFLGLINDRFVCKYNKADDMSQKKVERIKLNRNNYHFSEEEYIVLSNKMPRNVIEHLDERNVKTVMKNRGVGGFNVFFEDSDPEMINVINSNREFYPYNLDLINKKVLFFNVQAKADDVIEFGIDIMEMQAELKKLEQSVNEFATFIK